MLDVTLESFVGIPLGVATDTFVGILFWLMLDVTLESYLAKVKATENCTSAARSARQLIGKTAEMIEVAVHSVEAVEIPECCKGLTMEIVRFVESGAGCKMIDFGSPSGWGSNFERKSC